MSPKILFNKINCNVALTSLYLKKKLKKLGEGGGGGQSRNWELRTALSQLRIRSCWMSIMAFQLPIMEMAFALSEFEF